MIVFPFKSAGLVIPGIVPHDQLHKALSTENRHNFDRNAVLPHHYRTVGDNSAKRCIPGANLRCDVYAAPADGEFHIEPVSLKISLPFCQLDRAKSWENWGSREKVRHIFECKRRAHEESQ